MSGPDTPLRPPLIPSAACSERSAMDLGADRRTFTTSQGGRTKGYLCEHVIFSCFVTELSHLSGYNPSPFPAVFSRLPPTEAHPLLRLLPYRLPPKLHTHLALHLSLISELPRFMCSRRRGPFPLVLLLRTDHSRSETQSASLIPRTSSPSCCAKLWRHRDLLWSLRLARSPIPVPQLERKR